MTNTGAGDVDKSSLWHRALLSVVCLYKTLSSNRQHNPCRLLNIYNPYKEFHLIIVFNDHSFKIRYFTEYLLFS